MTSITISAEAGPIVTVKSNVQEAVSVSQIGTMTPLAIVGPAEKSNVLASGKDNDPGSTLGAAAGLGEEFARGAHQRRPRDRQF